MSKGFVSKWLQRIRKLLNLKYKNHKVSMLVFNSISTCLIIRKFRWRAHEAIIKLCNTKEYQRFGFQKLQKKLWEKHEIHMACSTIDKIRRQKGLL